MRIHMTYWRVFWTLFIAAFLALNGYHVWISTMKMPFCTDIDLSKAGGTYAFDLSRFYSGYYLCCLGISVPREEHIWGSHFSQLNDVMNRVQSDMDSEVDIQLTGKHGAVPFKFHGSIGAWNIDNRSYSAGSGVTLWAPPFHASLWDRYRLQITVIKPPRQVTNYHPQFLFHDVDDGEFAIRIFINNLVLILLMNISAAGSCFVRWINRDSKAVQDRKDNKHPS